MKRNWINSSFFNLLIIIGMICLIIFSIRNFNKIKEYNIKIGYLEKLNENTIREHKFSYSLYYFLKTNAISLKDEKNQNCLLDQLSMHANKIFLWLNDNACNKCIIESISTLLPYLELKEVILNIILDGNLVIELPNSKYINIWRSDTSNPTKSFLNESSSFYFTIDSCGSISNVQLLDRATSIDMGLYLRIIQQIFK